LLCPNEQYLGSAKKKKALLPDKPLTCGLKEGIEAVSILKVRPHGSSIAWSYGHLFEVWGTFWGSIVPKYPGTRKHYSGRNL